MVRVEVSDVYLGMTSVQRTAPRTQREPWHTFPYSVKVIFACLRLTTGHRKRARSGSSAIYPWLGFRPTDIVRDADLLNDIVSGGCPSYSLTCRTMPSSLVSTSSPRGAS